MPIGKLVKSATKMFGLGGDGSPPPAPDFVGAARTQGKASNPNVFTPFGSQTVTWDGDIPTVNQSLSPELQDLFGRAGQFDMSGIPQAPINPGQTGQDAIMSRLQPQIERREERLRTQLVNQGIMPGSEAYKNAFIDEGQRSNDLMTQATLHGIGLDTSARAQAFGEQSFLHSLPFQDYAAIRGLLPQTGFQPPPIFDATRAQGDWAADLYNAEQAASANETGALYGLGGNLALAYALSDKRYKRDIEPFGELPSGIPVYVFRYFDDRIRRLGVMADEVEKVMPEVVIEVDGIKLVNYAKLH